MKKCEGCKKECDIVDIKNYVVRYESWQAYNCCCKECAKKSAIADGMDENEIIDIE